MNKKTKQRARTAWHDCRKAGMTAEQCARVIKARFGRLTGISAAMIHTARRADILARESATCKLAGAPHIKRDHGLQIVESRGHGAMHARFKSASVRAGIIEFVNTLPESEQRLAMQMWHSGTTERDAILAGLMQYRLDNPKLTRIRTASRAQMRAKVQRRLDRLAEPADTRSDVEKLRANGWTTEQILALRSV